MCHSGQMQRNKSGKLWAGGCDKARASFRVTPWAGDGAKRSGGVAMVSWLSAHSSMSSHLAIAVEHTELLAPFLLFLWAQHLDKPRADHKPLHPPQQRITCFSRGELPPAVLKQRKSVHCISFSKPKAHSPSAVSAFSYLSLCITT